MCHSAFTRRTWARSVERIGGACLLIVALGLAGCGARLTHYAAYRGDGTFTPDAAPNWLCSDGYTVDLGVVDLSLRGEQSHVLVGLPPAEAIVGLAVRRGSNAAAADGDASSAHRPDATVEITVRDADDRIVLSRHERLTQWIATRTLKPDRAFLFQRGIEAEIPVAPGAARVERFPIGIDDSWGTYFTPRREARYALHFAVEEPDAEMRDVGVRLQVRGVVGCL